MEKIEFKAKAITASKSSRDNYYMVGLADDEYNYDKYILFQRPLSWTKTTTQTPIATVCMPNVTVISVTMGAVWQQLQVKP